MKDISLLAIQPRWSRKPAVDLDQIPTDDSSAARLLCALDDALESLRQIDPRRVRVIELI